MGRTFEKSELVFAAWLRGHEGGEEQSFEDLAATHPGERADLEELHEAWKLLSSAIGAHPVLRARARAEAPSLLADRYRKLELLGRGGQGEVWLAEDTRLGRRVALKLLARPDPDRMRRFAREAAVTSRLEHPGLGAVYESGEEDGAAFIAMRYVEGASLAEWIERERARWAEERAARSHPPSPSSAPSRPSEIERVVRILVRTARALHAAREAGVIHRDVKPANILVTKDDEPVLVDFGFAADTENDWSALTLTAQFLGTPAYMSPEQILGKGRGELDRRTDVWSLGVTLYECLTGRRPFDGSSWQAVFHAIGESEPAAARTLNPTLPADLEVILATALEKDRERRYRNAAALADDLEAWLDGRPVAARKTSLAGRLARWARREPALATLLAALALALPALGALASYAVHTRAVVRAGEAAERQEEREALLVEAFASIDTPKEALALFDRALARGASFEEAQGGRTLALLDLGRREEAFATLAELAPTSAGLRQLEAGLHRRAGTSGRPGTTESEAPPPTSAIGSFLRALSAMPAHATERIDAPGEEIAGDVATAKRYLRAALLYSPAPSLLYMMEYVHALGHGQDSARELAVMTQVIGQHWPDSPVATLKLAQASMHHDAGRARELARRAIELDPSRKHGHLILGMLLAEQGDFDAALAAYDRALALEPTDAQAHYNRGLTLRKKGDWRGAADAYRESLRLQPAGETWNNLGTVLNRLGDLEGGTAAFREAVRLGPRDAVAHFNLARNMQLHGELDDALETFRRGQELARGQPELDLPTAEWEENLLASIEDRQRIDDWLTGVSAPPAPEEQMRLADQAYAIGRFEDSVQILVDLLAVHPELAEESPGGPRTTAAYAAAWLAHTRAGEEGRGWRSRALEWLWAELAVLERLLSEDPNVAVDVATVLQRWRDNPGIRLILDEELPSDSPPTEREAVHELAARVRELAAELGLSK